MRRVHTVLERERARCDRYPRGLAGIGVGSVERPYANPRPGEARLPSGVGKLNSGDRLLEHGIAVYPTTARAIRAHARMAELKGHATR